MRTEDVLNFYTRELEAANRRIWQLDTENARERQRIRRLEQALADANAKLAKANLPAVVPPDHSDADDDIVF